MKELSKSIGKDSAKVLQTVCVNVVNVARLTTEISIPISIWLLEFAQIWEQSRQQAN
jgi:hypothetical protein